MSLDAAHAAFMAGNLDQAELLARSGPADNARAMLLTRILIAGERMEEAEAVISSLAAAGTHVKAMRLLASLQYRRTAFDACEQTLERLTALEPVQAQADEFQQLAKLKALSGRESEARAVMRRAMDAYPDDLQLVMSHAELLSDKDAACAELEQALGALAPDRLSEIAYVLKRITMLRAPLRRRIAGQPEFGRSWDDCCRWPDPEGLERLRKVLIAGISRPAPSVSEILDAAWVAVSQKNWDLAQTLLDHVWGGGTRGTLADFAHFGGPFHDQLTAVGDDAMEHGLAPVKTLLAPAPATGRTLFVASSVNYFQQFTLPFLRRLDALAIPLDVHVHLLDGPAAAWDSAREGLREMTSLGLGLSAEDSGAAARGLTYARHYYHAVRYIRFFQELKRSGRCMWILDADVRALHDPRPMLASLKGFDLALRSNPLAFEPSLKLMACCVGVAPTERGLAFARQVAAYIFRMKEAGTWGWGVDQMALFSAYAYMEGAGAAPKTLFLGADAVCLNDQTSGALQFPAGISKFFSRHD